MRAWRRWSEVGTFQRGGRDVTAGDTGVADGVGPPAALGLDLAQGARTWLILAAVGIGAALLTLLTSTGEPRHDSMAWVVAQGPEGTTLAGFECSTAGTETSTQLVPWSSVADAEVGDTVPVDLAGGDPCALQEPRRSAAIAIVGAVVGLGAVAMLVRYARTRRYVRAQRLSTAAGLRGAPVQAVEVRPTFAKGSRIQPKLFLEVCARDTGGRLGWVQVGGVLPGFDPRRLAWLVGEPVVGAPVALDTDDRSARICPIGALDLEPPTPLACSDALVRVLGWEAPPPASAPPVVSTGYHSLSMPGAGAHAELARAAEQARARVKRCAWVPMVGLFAAIGLLYAPVPLVVPVAVFVATMLSGRILTPWVQRDLDRLVLREAPELAPHRRLASTMVGGLLAPAAAPAAASPAAPEPGGPLAAAGSGASSAAPATIPNPYVVEVPPPRGGRLPG